MRLPCLPIFRSAAFFFVSALAFGAPAPGGYFFRSWRTENGLTDNSVNTVLQDSRGYLWLATMTGLARFDGRKFEEFALPAELRESGENIRALALEDPSTLVLLPASGGVARFRDGRFLRHPLDAALQARRLQQLFMEPDGALWLGDTDGDVFRWQDGQLKTFTPADGLTNHLVGFSAATDSQGRTWIAEGDFLGWYDHGSLVRFPPPLGTGLVIAPARSGGIWISADDRLLKWEQGRLLVLSTAPDWPGARELVQHLFEDRQGVLWIATRRNGLYQFAAGQLRGAPTQQQGLSWVTEDSEQGLWVASRGGGISRLQSQRFLRIHPGPGRDDVASTAVCEDASGAIWCANRSGGVLRYADDATQRIKGPAGEPSPFYADSVCPDHSGTIWVGAASGLYRVDAAHPQALTLVDPTLKGIHVLYFSRQGELWISSGVDRLGRLHGGKYEELTPQQGFPGKFTVAIAETTDGTLWVALERELYAYLGGRLVRQTAYDAFPGERISALCADQAGALWIGTARGLLRLKAGRLTAYTQANGLPNERIEQILEDGHGLLWLNSRQGFFHVPLADLEAVAAGRQTQVAAVTFGPEEGLSGQTPVSNCQPNAWRSHANRLWFCTQEGVVGIDANAVPRELPPPPVYIERVLLDGRGVEPAGLRLSTGRHRLVFYFSSPSFAAPEKVRLRYRLRGFDNSWIETVSDQEANYTGLRAGRYTLEVAASDPNGIWRDRVGAALSFVVTPLWWETWWARVLGVTAFTGCIVWFARDTSHRLLKRRLRRIEQEHALDKERARIARDLHDELGGSLIQIGLLAERLKRHPQPAELDPGLGQLARHTRRLSGELESIIWTVNPRNNSLDRFARFVRQFSRRFFQDTALECAVQGVEEIPALPLSPGVQHHLLTATKEALTNVLKHARADSVTIELRFAHGVLTTMIRDNGIGFDPEAAENDERNGLANIRSRLQEIGGALKVQSSPGRGTAISWQVSLPVTAAATGRLAGAPADS